ncbi:MAG: glycosyltransferase [Candidatus Omnitrophica bacterium]|nr:glycosyltransferase [Candidatus Omnitrophota bacterium]
MRKKVLIFYISKFSGHYHAAEAIEKGLQKTCPDDVLIEKINALEYTNPLLGKVINKAYIEIIKKRPELWGHIYDNPDFMEKTQRTRDALHKFNMSKIRRLMEKHSPDVVFCTQAFPCGMVSDYKRSCGKRFSLIGVLTDHAPHSYWLFAEVDKYVVPSNGTRDVLVRKGVPEEKIKVFGIPVDPRFEQTLDASAIKRRLSLDESLPVVLIMGGSQGLGAVENVVRSLSTDPVHRYHLLVVAGKNKRLYSRIKHLAKASGGGKVNVFSYLENIDELMEIADIIVTKAGGMTTSEAIVKKLPMVIVDPIPGHERMNADFLVKSGAAVEADGYARVPEIIDGIFDSPERLEDMVSCIEKIARPGSASNIASLAIED